MAHTVDAHALVDQMLAKAEEYDQQFKKIVSSNDTTRSTYHMCANVWRSTAVLVDPDYAEAQLRKKQSEQPVRKRKGVADG